MGVYQYHLYIVLMSRKSNKKQGLGAVHKVRHALRGEGEFAKRWLKVTWGGGRGSSKSDITYLSQKMYDFLSKKKINYIGNMVLFSKRIPSPIEIWNAQHYRHRNKVFIFFIFILLNDIKKNSQFFFQFLPNLFYILYVIVYHIEISYLTLPKFFCYVVVLFLQFLVSSVFILSSSLFS